MAPLDRNKRYGLRVAAMINCVRWYVLHWYPSIYLTKFKSMQFALSFSFVCTPTHTHCCGQSYAPFFS